MNNFKTDYSPKILILGGGGAAPGIAEGIAEALPYAQVDIAQAGSDHGGSSGELRDVFGVAAPGDSRNAIGVFASTGMSELSSSKFGPDATLETVRERGDTMFDLVTARGDVDTAWAALQFDATDETAEELTSEGYSLQGHAYGNMLLTGGAISRGNNMNHSIEATSTLLGVPKRHTIMQTSDIPAELRLHDSDADGNEVIIDGEGTIDTHVIMDAKNAWVEFQEPAPITEALARAISEADVVISASGSFMTSVAAALLADKTPKALSQMKSGAMIIALANLAADGVTPTWDLDTLVEKLEQYTNPGDQPGRNIDGIMFNDAIDAIPEGVHPIIYDAHNLDKAGKLLIAISGDFVSAVRKERDPYDKVEVRSGVLHNGSAIGYALKAYLPHPHLPQVSEYVEAA